MCNGPYSLYINQPENTSGSSSSLVLQTNQGYTCTQLFYVYVLHIYITILFV